MIHDEIVVTATVGIEDLVENLDEEGSLHLIKRIDEEAQSLEFTEQVFTHFAKEIISSYKAHYADDFTARKVVELLDKVLEEIPEAGGA